MACIALGAAPKWTKATFEGLRNDYDEYENPQLREACQEGNLKEVKSQLDRWQSARSPSGLAAKHLENALIGAISAGQSEVVDYLLNNGAEMDPEIVEFALDTSVKMFEIFLQHGWDINSRTGTGAPALKHLVSNEAMVEWFLDHGADPNVLGSHGESILTVAAFNSTPKVIDMLQSHGANLLNSDALHAASARRDMPGGIAMAMHLLQLGMDVNMVERWESPPSRGEGRGTPLHTAASYNNPGVIAVLLDKGANRDARNTLGQTPLELAIVRNGKEAAEKLQQGHGKWKL
ncbi:hypothetical protein MMC17_006164 [Xylographa soralifera]|nr:hypothetical protein [Xylographa soralifera]